MSQDENENRTVVRPDQAAIIVDADGSNARVASPNTQIILSEVEWSANGNQIAYAMATQPHALGVELFVTDLQQNQVRKITTGAGWTVFSAELRFNADASRSVSSSGGG